MKKNLLKISILSATVIGLFAIGGAALADSTSGTLKTGISGNTGNNNDVDGIVIAPPIANPTAGIYTSAQSVTLTADGASSIKYTTDGTTPTCSTSTGNVYSGAISVAVSEPIEAISCYPNNISSTVASYLYGINLPTPAISSGSVSSSGSYSSGGGTGSTFLQGDANKDGKVDVLDFVILMANWGKTGTGNLADFNSDGKVDIQDFVILMANWTK